MRLGNALHLYRVRLRARAIQELLAVLGIAVGVALLFASEIADTSLTSSAAALSKGILGRASLQLLARSEQGFPEGVVARVRGLPGVAAAAPLLEAQANVVGPRGAASAELVGADETLAGLGGSLVARTRLAPFGGVEAILLTAGLAGTVGVGRFGQEAIVQIAGHVSSAPLYKKLGTSQIGPLAHTPLLIAPLSFAQQMAGLGGRISRILVEPRPGQTSAVRSELERLAADRLSVEPADYDERVFDRASAASSQSTELFAAVSALIGFLFAFNATLLSATQRRQLVGMLGREGYSLRTAAGLLLLDAATLGAVSSVLGLLLGYLLSASLFNSHPGYLSSGFTVGTATTVKGTDIVVACAGGMLAATLAVLAPLFSSPARLSPLRLRRREHWLTATGLVLAAASTVAGLLDASLALAALIGLALSLLALLPFALNGAVLLLRTVARRRVGAGAHLAVFNLQATRGRIWAVSAIVALAVFGSVSIQGARSDLQNGLRAAAREMNSFTQLWISPAGSFDLLMTQRFEPARLSALRAVPGVASVSVYRGALLDWGEHRVWVLAPPSSATPLLPQGQLVTAGGALAERRLRTGGWGILSRGLAAELNVRVGGWFTLPAPRPARLRLAALSTNIGWSPGAAILNSRDFAAAWQSGQASALDVLLKAGALPRTVKGSLTRALGAGGGLTVQTAGEHEQRQRALTREGLSQLTGIAWLILIAAVLGSAAALAAMIWQRRPLLARLSTEGLSPVVLWRTGVTEGSLTTAVGALIGAAFGLLGQRLLDRVLQTTFDYPVAASTAVSAAATAAVAVTLTAATMLAAPGWLAARTPASAIGSED